MQRPNSRFTAIVLNNNREIQLGYKVHRSKLHANGSLKEISYTLIGDVKATEVSNEDVLVTIDAFAYRARHQTTAASIRLRTGLYKFYGSQRPYKLAGVIRSSTLFLLTVDADKRVSDIAPQAPMRVKGLTDLHTKVYKLSKVA